MTDKHWYLSGACYATENTLADFSDEDNPDPALLVCARCPVRGSCLVADFKESLNLGLTSGIRAGMLSKERMELFVSWEPLYKVPTKRLRERGPNFDY